MHSSIDQIIYVRVVMDIIDGYCRVIGSNTLRQSKIKIPMQAKNDQPLKCI